MNENRIFEMSRAGVLPDTTADCTDRIGAALAENEENVTYLFEKGVYRFHASNGLSGSIRSRTRTARSMSAPFPCL